MSATLKILIYSDDKTYSQHLVDGLKDANYPVLTVCDISVILRLLREEKIFLVILCVDSPDEEHLGIIQKIKENYSFTEIIIISKRSNLNTAFSAMRLGAYEYLTKTPNIAEYIPIVDSVYKHVSRKHRKCISCDSTAGKTGSDYNPLIIGKHPKIRTVLDMVRRAAPTDTPVLIIGETGVGKELVAQAIHKRSLRRDRPFLAFSCSAVPETLIENELFGHEKGAFTDATKTKCGLLEQANNGTVFLDEIGELHPAMQVKLLRVLETGKFRRLGGGSEIAVDIRIISATNKDLYSEIRKRNFRADLYYRLAVITLPIPALSQRREDIPLLIDYFIDIANRYSSMPKKISSSAIKMLTEYDWPGNIRELKNCIERLVILSENEIIKPTDVALAIPNACSPDSFISPLVNSTESMITNSSSFVSLEEVEKKYIQYIFEVTGQHQTKTSEILGISKRCLYDKLRRYKIIETHRSNTEIFSDETGSGNIENDTPDKE